MINKYISAIALSLAVTCAHSDVSSDMKSFFNSAGYESNYTHADVWKNQAAGSFSGGSLFARNAVRTYQLIRLDLPEFRAGCGGIDMFMGAFSFISADKLVEMGKQIMTNSGAYVVDLMLASTVPEILERKNYLQDVMTKINGSNINTCNAGKALVGGLWPKTTESQKKICRDLRTNEGIGNDFAKAQQDCESLDKFQETMDKAKNDKEYKKQVLMSKNIVWDAIKSQPFFNSNDIELSEFVMNLTGTIIFDGKGNPTIVPSIADNQQLIKAFIGDGTADIEISIKKCSKADEDKCLKVRDGKITIKQGESLSAKVQNLILGISDKLRARNNNKSESDWTEDEKRFVSMTSIPILKFITIMGQMKYGITSSDLVEYSSLIAQDLFQQYLGELLSSVKASIANSQIQEDLLKNIEKKVHDAQVTIASLDPKVSRKIQEKLAFVQKMQVLEKQVAADIANETKG